MPTRNVVLTDRQTNLIDTLVRSGRYQNASEVLREGLRLIENREAEEAAKLQALRDAVQVGLDDVEAGRYRDFNTPEALRTYLSQLMARAVKGQRS
jgi:antitoxin ParD1/3/4